MSLLRIFFSTGTKFELDAIEADDVLDSGKYNYIEIDQSLYGRDSKLTDIKGYILVPERQFRTEFHIFNLLLNS